MKKSFILLLLSFYSATAISQNYSITKKINIPGDEGWDYLSVDNVNQHLFVSHGSIVNVVDLKTDKPIATVTGLKGVRGIAIANDLNKAFISNGKDNSIAIINLKSFELIEKVNIEGQKPDAILYDPFSHYVFVFNAMSTDATVIDGKTNAILKTIPLGGKPEFSVTNTKGLVYVNIEDKNEIKTIDTKTLTVLNSWSIEPGEEPTGLAFDIQKNILFSVCGNKTMVIVDATTGKIIQTLPIGNGCDGVVFDTKNKMIFSANGEGNITAVKEISNKKYSIVQTIPTQKNARTITINPTTSQLYLPTAEFGATPKPTAENPKPRAILTPNSFVVLVVNNNHM